MQLWAQEKRGRSWGFCICSECAHGKYTADPPHDAVPVLDTSLQYVTAWPIGRAFLREVTCSAGKQRDFKRRTR